MPSQALLTFEKDLIKDVELLIDTHEILNSSKYTGRGRRHLGHVTRSGIVMLCAAWERYIELLAVESVRHISDKISSPELLPKTIKKHMALYAKNHKNELKPFLYAGDGWKSEIVEIVKERTDSMHTPKSCIVDKLFMDLAGVKKLSDNWSISSQRIDDFISQRGEIAHKGRDTANYIKIGHLKDQHNNIVCIVNETDNFMADHIQSIIGRSPWRRRLL